MTKKQAIKRVRNHAAALILCAIDNADEGIFLDDSGQPLSPADQERIKWACGKVADDILRYQSDL